MGEPDRSPATDSSLELCRPSSVLLVLPRWTRDGGISAHVQASAALLAEQGIDVRVLAAQADTLGEDPEVALYRSSELFNVSAPAATRLGDARSFRPDVVHFHQVDDPDLVEAFQTRSPVVMSVHQYSVCTSGAYYFEPGRECTRSHGPGCVAYLAARRCSPGFEIRHLLAKYKGRTVRLDALKQADLVISYSNSVDRHLAANGLARRRVVSLFTTTTPNTGSDHRSRRRVVFAGRIVKQKGVDVLIRAAHDVDAEFVICGDGRRLPGMRELAQRLGVQERIRFKGWLDPEELAEELAEASVVVMPSLWPEPFGLVGIEAMAAGRPVVASKTGGIVDWLEDGVTGIGVRPGDAPALAEALNELLDDPDKQQAMGVAGKKLVNARFSPERHIAALLASYQAARTSWESRTDASLPP